MAIRKKRKYVKRRTVRKKVTPSRDFQDPLYKEWRKKILTRDNYTCQWPGCSRKKGIYLNCHHIRRWSNYPTLRYDINNGITLCKPHHKAIQNKEDDYILFFLQLLSAKIRHRQSQLNYLHKNKITCKNQYV